MIALGIDAASCARDVAVAVARWDGQRCKVLEVFRGDTRARMGVEIPERLATYLADGPSGLIAIDAPLGWPQPMVELVGGDAGRSLPRAMVAADPFLRLTDRIVRELTGKLPLAVGADRIARMTAETLVCLGTLRERTGLPLPLAWSPHATGWNVIEVYPAATRAAHPGGRAVRRPGLPRETDEERLARTLAVLCHELTLDEPVLRRIGTDGHMTDACLAVLAVQDFLRGHALTPRASDEQLARREGWIWCHALAYCRRCATERIRGWRGMPRGFGGAARTEPALPELPVVTTGGCPSCSRFEALPRDHIVFVSVHGPHDTGLPDHWELAIEPPGSQHQWLEAHGIPLPYASAQCESGTQRSLFES